MRPTCTFCARKHLSQALILLEEARQGYPQHVWLAIGHLAEAGDELVADFPALANTIRGHRKALESSLAAQSDGSGHTIPFLDLIQACSDAQVLGSAEMAKIAERAKEVAVAAVTSMTVPVTTAQAITSPTQRPPAPAKCPSCEEGKRLKAASARWKEQNGELLRSIAIITCLNDFRPSYSLVSVILDQVLAASLLPKTRVLLFVNTRADLSLLPPLPDNVEVFPTVPVTPMKEDVIEERIVMTLESWARNTLNLIGGGTVITHDLVFQSWFSSFAKAWHNIGAVVGYEFYHMIHSSVGERPQSDNARWRCSIPEGHTMVALNTADIPHLARYYDAPPERFVTLHNPRDVRAFLGMPPAARALVTKHQLHMATVMQVYPLSAPRMLAKGVLGVIEVLKHVLLQLEGDTSQVRLVIADAHANGTEGKNAKALVKDAARTTGFPEECLVFTSDSLGENDISIQAHGIDQQSIRALFQLANVFIFPTTSEAGSLVLMEAAMSGNLLVLNESLPCLTDYVATTDAIWAPFGSVKERGRPFEASAIAARILDHANSPVVRAKRAMIQAASLETYAGLLETVLRHPLPGRAQTIPPVNAALMARAPAARPAS